MLLVAAAAYSAALAVSAGVAFWLDAEPPASAAGRPALGEPETAAPESTRVNYPAIFQRNLFGSEPAQAAGSNAPAKPTQTDLALRGTAALGERGFAVFEDVSSGVQDVFAIGDKIFDGPKLVGVQERRAVILRGSKRVTIEISDEETEPQPVKTAAASTTPAAGSIRRTGENAFLVDRREVDHQIENLSTVVTQLRAVPFLRDGKSIGFRVFNIRPGSVFERMGLKNGDIVQSVNGTELNDPSKALALLDDVQTSDEIRIDLLRQNQPTTFSYTVR